MDINYLINCYFKILIGRLVPDSTIEKLMISEIKGIANRGWILDGFPRTLPQAESLAKSEAIDSVLYLDVPFDTIIGRVKDRWLHCPSGRIYNLLYNPPKVPGKDDITGDMSVCCWLTVSIA